jgi:hypothetical protein
MLGSTVLELALGLCVFYIALSLICSGVTQYLSEWRQWRGRVLVDILAELFNHEAHQGESVLSSLLADARIAGGSPAAKKDKASAGEPALVLPAGGRIDKFVFADTVLDLVAGKVIKRTEAAANAEDAGAGAGQAPVNATVQLIQRLAAAIDALHASLAVSLSGADLANWDTLLQGIKTRIDALNGLPLDEVNRQAEAILKSLQVAATAEGQAVIRARLLEAIGRETEAVLGLARKLTTAQAMALFAGEMPESPFRSFLIRLGNRGALEPEEAKKAIQDWYASVSDRVSVEYRGKAKRILFFTAMGVTLVLNADTFQVANRLVKDDALRKVVSQEAVELSETPDNAPAATKSAITKEAIPTPKSASSPASATTRSSDSRGGSGSLERLDLPLRWTANDWNTLKGIANYSQPEAFFNGLYKLIGLIVTALALTMGAEFWYNILKQLVPSLPGQKTDQPGRT